MDQFTVTFMAKKTFDAATPTQTSQMFEAWAQEQIGGPYFVLVVEQANDSEKA